MRSSELGIGLLLLFGHLAAIPAANAEVLALRTPQNQTGIMGVPLTISPPELASVSGDVFWSLFNPPDGMVIDPITGLVTWPAPAIGHYHITTTATTSQGQDHAEWVLHVVTNDFPDPQIIRTKHINFVVPPETADWMASMNAGAYADATWEGMRDLFGDELGEGKQIVRRDPTVGGGAHNGNPVESETFYWGTNDRDGWFLGAWVHEVGHNFLGRIRAENITSNNWADRFFHHLTELVQVAMMTRCLNAPEDFGMDNATAASYRVHADYLRGEMERRGAGYFNWLNQGGRAEDYVGDYYGAWSTIVWLLSDDFGPQMLENSLRALRPDGIPQELFAQADSPLKQNTLLFAIMSAAAGTDLRSRFDLWGFDVDDTFFNGVWPEVSNTVSQLPQEDTAGWKRCPLNGHYYRFTGWRMTWSEAERHARRLGGHLATVRNEEEMEWLTSRFRYQRPLWIGLHDSQHEGQWEWTSDEAVEFTCWGPPEPNGILLENYAAMNWYEDGGWNDAGRETHLYGIVEVTSPPAECDLDHDRLPDAWELTHAGDARILEPDEDPDEDGLSNWGEFVSGTSPIDPASCLRLEAQKLPDGRLRITWPGSDGTRYTLTEFESVLSAKGSAIRTWEVPSTVPTVEFTPTSVSEAPTYYFLEATPR